MNPAEENSVFDIATTYKEIDDEFQRLVTLRNAAYVRIRNAAIIEDSPIRVEFIPLESIHDYDDYFEPDYGRGSWNLSMDTVAKITLTSVDALRVADHDVWSTITRRLNSLAKFIDIRYAGISNVPLECFDHTGEFDATFSLDRSH